MQHACFKTERYYYWQQSYSKWKEKKFTGNCSVRCLNAEKTIEHMDNKGAIPFDYHIPEFTMFQQLTTKIKWNKCRNLPFLLLVQMSRVFQSFLAYPLMTEVGNHNRDSWSFKTNIFTKCSQFRLKSNNKQMQNISIIHYQVTWKS